MQTTITSVPLCRYDQGQWLQVTDPISLETQLTIHWQSPAASGSVKLWAWPKDLLPLCLGHILLDKILPKHIHTPLANLLAWQGTVQATMPNTFSVSFQPKSPLPAPDPPADLSVAPQALLQAMAELLNSKPSQPSSWDLTGSIHRMGLFDPKQGKFIVQTEDIARHNCLDRLLGFLSQNKLNPSNYILFLTARISAGLYSKLALAGFKFLVSKGALTSQALIAAPLADLTLVGFCKPREHRFSIFAGAKRIKDCPCLE